MTAIQQLRAYHALLSLLAVIAYLTGEAGLIHALLGYAIGLVILARLAAALGGAPLLGLARFYPHFQGLRLGTAFTHPAFSKSLLAGIAFCLIGATATGIAIDRGHALGLGTAPALIAPARADAEERGRERRESHPDQSLRELHEGLSNGLVVMVGLHILYALIYKLSLLRFMLFLPKSGPKA